MRMPKWPQGSKEGGQDIRQQARRLRQSSLIDESEEGLCGDQFEQQPIQPKEIDEETQRLIDELKETLATINKAECTEIKNFNNPPEEVKQVIVTIADFFEGLGHEWKNSKAKMADLILKRGHEATVKCTEDQYNVLKVFEMTGITADSVNPKSKAAAGFVRFLKAAFVLQERLHSLQDEQVKQGLPDVEGVDLTIEGARIRSIEGMYATV